MLALETKLILGYPILNCLSPIHHF